MELLDINKSSDHKGLVATIGFFDGVHLGHQFLLDQVRAQAGMQALSSAVITFTEHPRKVLNAHYQPALLCGYDEKIERIANTKVDYCCPLVFTVEMSQLSARDFMQQILRDKLNVKTLLVGYDHSFGHDRHETVEDYINYGKDLGIEVIQAEELDSSINVSSSTIRLLLAGGKVEDANKLLSYNYTIAGEIVEGFKVGRTIGFPTANMQVWERYKVIPALGVYAVRVDVDGLKYNAMLYIGRRPTLYKEEDISIEVNLFDFDGDLYGKVLKAEFIEFVRHDEKFQGLEKLKEAIQRDKNLVKNILDKYQF